MKRLSKLKLNQISKTELEDREMHSLLGGNQCACGCEVASTNTNGAANAFYGYTYTAGWTGGGNDTCACMPASCVTGAGKGHNL